MKSSTKIQEYVNAYELEYGKKPCEQVIAIIEHVELVGNQVKQQARFDMASGRVPRTKAFFCGLFCKVFGLEAGRHDETVEAIADLWLMYYTDSYNAAKDGDSCES